MTARNLVLVIDDELHIREALCDILELIGLPTLTACDGREGSAQFVLRRAESGLVILDWMMPVMDGAETLLALRTLDPQVKVLISSGLDEQELSQRIGRTANLSMPNAFLQKPYKGRGKK